MSKQIRLCGGSFPDKILKIRIKFKSKYVNRNRTESTA